MGIVYAMTHILLFKAIIFIALMYYAKCDNIKWFSMEKNIEISIKHNFYLVWVVPNYSNKINSHVLTT